MTQQTIVASNLILPLRIHNHIDNEINNNNKTLMREVEINSIQYQSVDNNESNWKI